MEKPGIEYAAMIWGAGASMLHIARNLNIAYIKNHKKTAVAAEPNTEFSDVLENISGWTVKLIMALILISSTYHMFFSGAGNIGYGFGIAISLVYFFFFADFSMPKAARMTSDDRTNGKVFEKQ
jgi:hypothetical protein